MQENRLNLATKIVGEASELGYNRAGRNLDVSCDRSTV
jgi:hypothetical protein